MEALFYLSCRELFRLPDGIKVTEWSSFPEESLQKARDAEGEGGSLGCEGQLRRKRHCVIPLSPLAGAPGLPSQLLHPVSGSVGEKLVDYFCLPLLGTREKAVSMAFPQNS